jgi:ribonuclease BN (tRNA processing enzyme)
VELIVLGSGGGWAHAGGAASGYLLCHEGFNLWIDAGTGTLANLQDHIPFEDVGAIVVSHRHFDHFLDLYPLFLARWYRKDGPKLSGLPLFAPPGMFEHALQLEPELPLTYDLNVVQPGESFHAGPFNILTAPMRHLVPTLGMRIEADGQALAYTADTGPTEELTALARGADVLLSEATWLDMPLTAGPFHMTPAEAGEHARRAEAARLVLTHLWPTYDRAAMAERAMDAFGEAVELAREGTVVEL